MTKKMRMTVIGKRLPDMRLPWHKLNQRRMKHKQGKLVLAPTLANYNPTGLNAGPLPPEP